MFFIVFSILMSLIISIQPCSISTIGGIANPSSAYRFASVTSLTNSTFLIIYCDVSQTNLVGSIIDLSGATIASGFSATSSMTTLYPAVVHLSNKFMLIFSHSNSIFYQFISETGTLIGSHTQISTSLAGNYARASLLTNGNIAITYCSNINTAIYMVIMDQNGAIVLGESIINSAGPLNDFGIASLKGGGFAIAYAISTTTVNLIICDNSGNKIVTDFQANSASAATNSFSLAGISNGKLVFAFLDLSQNIIVKSFFPNGTVDSPETSITPSSNALSFPLLSAIDNGGYSIIYETTTSIVMTLFKNDGTQLLLATSIGSGSVSLNIAGTFLSSSTYVFASYSTFTPNNIDYKVVTLTSCDTLDTNSTLNSTVIVGSNSSNTTNGSTNGNSSSNSTSNLTSTKDYVLANYLGMGTGIYSWAMFGVSIFTDTHQAFVWRILEFLQTNFFFLFLNLNIPGNLIIFLEKFSFSNLDFLPSIIIEYNLFEFPAVDSPTKFKNQNFTGLFLQVTNTNFQLWIGLGIIYLFLLFTRINSNMISNFKNSLNNSFPIKMWIHCAPFFVICSSLQFYHFQDGLITTLSAVLAISILGMILLSFLLFLSILFREPDYSYVWRPLYEEYSTKDIKKRIFPLISITKRVSMAVVIVYLYDYPKFQVFAELSIMILYAVLMLELQPKRSKIENTHIIIAEVINVLIGAGFAANIHEFEFQNSEILGYILIGSIIFNTVFYSLPTIKNLVGSTRRICKKKIKKLPNTKKYLIKSEKTKSNLNITETVMTAPETILESQNINLTVEDVPHTEEKFLISEHVPQLRLHTATVPKILTAKDIASLNNSDGFAQKILPSLKAPERPLILISENVEIFKPNDPIQKSMPPPEPSDTQDSVYQNLALENEKDKLSLRSPKKKIEERPVKKNPSRDEMRVPYLSEIKAEVIKQHSILNYQTSISSIQPEIATPQTLMKDQSIESIEAISKNSDPKKSGQIVEDVSLDFEKLKIKPISVNEAISARRAMHFQVAVKFATSRMNRKVKNVPDSELIHPKPVPSAVQDRPITTKKEILKKMQRLEKNGLVFIDNESESVNPCDEEFNKIDE